MEKDRAAVKMMKGPGNQEMRISGPRGVEEGNFEEKETYLYTKHRLEYWCCVNLTAFLVNFELVRQQRQRSTARIFNERRTFFSPFFLSTPYSH